MDGVEIVGEGHETFDSAIMIECIPCATIFVNPCDKFQIVLNV